MDNVSLNRIPEERKQVHGPERESHSRHRGDILFLQSYDALASDWDSLNSMAYRFGSATEGDIVAIGTSGRIVEYPCGTSASGCQSWKILPGRYDFAADFLSMTLSVHNAWTLGVEYVGDKDAGPVYYTIEGLRVEQPTEGLYIVVRDGKASKQLIKR